MKLGKWTRKQMSKSKRADLMGNRVLFGMLLTQVCAFFVVIAVGLFMKWRLETDQRIALEKAVVEDTKDLLRDNVDNLIWHIELRSEQVEEQVNGMISFVESRFLRENAKVDGAELMDCLNVMRESEGGTAVRIGVIGEEYCVLAYHDENRAKLKMMTEEDLYSMKSEAIIWKEIMVKNKKMMLFSKMQDMDNAVKKQITEMLQIQKGEGEKCIWIKEVVNWDGGDNYAVRVLDQREGIETGQWLSTHTINGDEAAYEKELVGVREQGEIFMDTYGAVSGERKAEELMVYSKGYERFDWIISAGESKETTLGYANALSDESDRILRRIIIGLFIAGTIGFVIDIIFLAKQALDYRRMQLALEKQRQVLKEQEEELIAKYSIEEELDNQKKITEAGYAILSNSLMRFRQVDGNYELISFNESTVEIFGFDNPDEFRKSWVDGATSNTAVNDREELKRGYDSLEKQWDTTKIFGRITHPDGSLHYMKGECVLIYIDSSRKEFLASVTDVTDSIELQNQLRKAREEKELLDNVYAIMQTGIIRLRVEYESEIAMINPAGLRLLGVDSIEELYSRRKNLVVDTIFEEDAEVLRNKCRALKKQWDSVTTECRVRWKDDSVHYLHVHTTLISAPDEERILQRMYHDVTEEHLAEERMKKERKENYLDQIFGVLEANTQDAYVLLSADDFNVEYVSESVERLLGVSAEDVKKDVTCLYPKNTKKDIVEKTIRSVFQREAIPMERERIHARTGESYWFKEALYHTKLDEKDMILFVMSDRTGEMEAKQTLEQALMNAEFANKAKTEFLSDMSHDIRTPMNAIIGLIELMKSEKENSSRTEQYVHQLEVASEHMLELINNVLDMSRIESGKTILEIKSFAIQELLNDIRTVYHTQTRAKGQNCQDEIEIPERNYLGDAVRIKKILLNLLSNAVKYTPQNGSIRFVAKVLRENSQGYDILQFIVEDNGIGMSKEFMQELYAPFAREVNTTDGGVGGTGLGMSIVKTLIDLMGGKIQVESTKGMGTTFIVELPLKRADAKGDEQVHLPETEELSLSGIHFLIAEDNDLNAQILIQLLENEGAICDHALNGEIALTMFSNSKEGTYDVILMDVQMPTMNGYKAASAIRGSGHIQANTIPIAAMTANAFKEDVQNALNSGMNAHIAKPINMEVLRKTVCGLLNKQARKG